VGFKGSSLELGRTVLSLSLNCFVDWRGNCRLPPFCYKSGIIQRSELLLSEVLSVLIFQCWPLLLVAVGSGDKARDAKIRLPMLIA
jgi:hypothetical protein